MVPEVSKVAAYTSRSVLRRLLAPVPMPRQKAPDNPPSRLSLISRHPAPVYPINTPYAVERLPNSIDTSLLPKTPTRKLSTTSPATMSQPVHPTLLIPGPIEFDDAVLQSMSHFR